VVPYPQESDTLCREILIPDKWTMQGINSQVPDLSVSPYE